MRTIFFALTLSAMLFAASAAFAYESTSFLEGPVQVLSQNDATLFEYPFVSRWFDSTYFALWGFYGDSDTAPITYNAVRRLLNTTDLSQVNDTNLTLSLTLTGTPVFASSTNGYVAVAGVAQNTTTTNGTATTTTYITVNVFPSNFESNPSVEVLIIGGTTNTTLGYNIHNLFFMNDYFYIVYAVTVSNTDTALFLAGFEHDGTLKFTSPLLLNTVDLSGNANVQAAQSGNTIVVAYREDTQGQVVYVTVDVSQSTVTDEQVVATDSGNNKFYPSAVVFSDDYFVILLTQTVNGDNTGLTVSVAGNATSAAVNFALTTGYATYTVAAAHGYYDGWFVITHQETTAADGSEDTLQLYNYTASSSSSAAANTSNSTNSTNSTNTTTASSSSYAQTLVLTNDGDVVQGFTLPNQSYYVLLLNTPTGATWTAGYIGQVFAQVSDNQFGASLKIAFTTLFAVVGMLFVF